MRSSKSGNGYLSLLDEDVIVLREHVGLVLREELRGRVVEHALSLGQVGDEVAESGVDINVDGLLVLDEDRDRRRVGDASNLRQRHVLHAAEEELLEELGLQEEAGLLALAAVVETSRGGGALQRVLGLGGIQINVARRVATALIARTTQALVVAALANAIGTHRAALAKHKCERLV